MTTRNTILEAHNQWATRPADQRFETLEQLADAVRARRLNSRSTDLDLSRIEIKEDNDALVINSTIAPCEPSHWAFGQLASTLKAPPSYLRTLPRPLVAQNLAHGLQKYGSDSVKFMTIASSDGGLNTLQAVTSTSYGRIWDADCVSAVQRIVERTGGKFHNPVAYVNNGQGFGGITGQQAPSGLYASDHDCFMFMVDGGSLLEAGPRAKLNRGFIVWNSETGAKTFGLMTFLFNTVCGNHIIMGATEVNRLLIRHTSGGPTRFDNEAMPTLKAYSEASAAPLIDMVKRAQDYLIPMGKPEELLDWAGKHGKFTKGEVQSARDFAKAEEGECRTLWQLVQGMTAYARGFDFTDARVDLEKRAGALMDLVRN